MRWFQAKIWKGIYCICTKSRHHYLKVPQYAWDELSWEDTFKHIPLVNGNSVISQAFYRYLQSLRKSIIKVHPNFQFWENVPQVMTEQHVIFCPNLICGFLEINATCRPQHIPFPAIAYESLPRSLRYCESGSKVLNAHWGVSLNWPLSHTHVSPVAVEVCARALPTNNCIQRS